MADEIRYASELSVVNGGQSASISLNGNADQTTPGAIQKQVSVTTGGVTIAFTGLTTPRWVQFKNIDPTNYVDIGPDSTGLVGFARLKAGEGFPVPLKPGITVKAIANTATCIVEITALET